jgi:hypothetical protein
LLVAVVVCPLLRILGLLRRRLASWGLLWLASLCIHLVGRRL